MMMRKKPGRLVGQTYEDGQKSQFHRKDLQLHLSHMRRFISGDTCKILAQAPVTSKLDYGNALLWTKWIHVPARGSFCLVVLLPHSRHPILFCFKKMNISQSENEGGKEGRKKQAICENQHRWKKKQRKKKRRNGKNRERKNKCMKTRTNGGNNIWVKRDGWLNTCRETLVQYPTPNITIPILRVYDITTLKPVYNVTWP